MKESLRSVLNAELPDSDDVIENSPFHLHEHIAGRHLSNASINLTGAGASTENLFTVVGTCRIESLDMEVTAVTDSTTFSNVKFELDDGAAQQDITNTVDGSGCAAEDMFVKIATSATALTYISAATGVVTDPAAGPPPQTNIFTPDLVTKKAGQTTQVRLSYTGDANTDITVTVAIHWVRVSSAGAIASV